MIGERLGMLICAFYYPCCGWMEGYIMRLTLTMIIRCLLSCRPTPTVWGSKLPFNTICGEYSSPAGGWVHAIGFSPSGDILAFASECYTFMKGV